MSPPVGVAALFMLRGGGGYCSVVVFCCLLDDWVRRVFFFSLFYSRHCSRLVIRCTVQATLVMSHWVPSTPMCVWTARATGCFPPAPRRAGLDLGARRRRLSPRRRQAEGTGEWVARGVDVRRRSSRSTPLARRCPHQRHPPPRRSPLEARSGTASPPCWCRFTPIFMRRLGGRRARTRPPPHAPRARRRSAPARSPPPCEAGATDMG